MLGCNTLDINPNNRYIIRDHLFLFVLTHPYPSQLCYSVAWYQHSYTPYYIKSLCKNTKENYGRKYERKLFIQEIYLKMGDIVNLNGEVNCTCFPLRGTFLLSTHPVPHFSFLPLVLFECN